MSPGAPTGMTSTPPTGELPLQRLGHMAAARRGEDRIEGRLLRQAGRAVAFDDADIGIAEALHPRRRQPGQLGMALDRDHLAGDPADHRSRVARARADLEHLVAGADPGRRDHLGDDIGLRNGLARPRSAAANRHRRNRPDARARRPRAAPRASPAAGGDRSIPRAAICRRTISSRAAAKSRHAGRMTERTCAFPQPLGSRSPRPRGAARLAKRDQLPERDQHQGRGRSERQRTAAPNGGRRAAAPRAGRARRNARAGNRRALARLKIRLPNR